jgi:hypothetical protein
MLIGYLDQLISNVLPSLLHYHWNLNITRLLIYCLIQAASSLRLDKTPAPRCCIARSSLADTMNPPSPLTIPSVSSYTFPHNLFL